jgi:hypothetical protein
MSHDGECDLGVASCSTTFTAPVTLDTPLLAYVALSWAPLLELVFSFSTLQVDGSAAATFRASCHFLSMNFSKAEAKFSCIQSGLLVAHSF